MSSGGSGGSGVISYSPWQETAARALMGVDDNNVEWTTQPYGGFFFMKALIDNYTKNGLSAGNTPYDDINVVNPDTAFLGGVALSSFPSAYDMFGKFMAGLDVEVLYAQEQADTVYSAPINASIAAESALLDADINANSYPRLEAGYTTMNAASGPGLAMAKAYIEDGKTRAMTKYAADLKMHAMDLAHSRWQQHLQWNAKVIEQYMSIIQNYFTEATQYVNLALGVSTGKVFFPFTILSHQRELVAMMNGGHPTEFKRESGFQRVASGVLGVSGLLTAQIPGIGKGGSSGSILGGLSSLITGPGAAGASIANVGAATAGASTASSIAGVASMVADFI